MSNIYITFFHQSESYLEKFNPKKDGRPTFYWFGDRYYNHYSTTTRFKYFYLFVKNPKKDNLRFRERYEGSGFNSLYSRYLKYKKERDQNLQKSIYDWLSPEPAILLSFSKITPDLILEFEDNHASIAVVIKPEGYKGLKITLFDNNNMPIQFIDTPIAKILPKIRHSLPFIESRKEKNQYVYDDWLDTEKIMQETKDKSQTRSSMNLRRRYNQKLKDNFKKNLVRALNEEAKKYRETY